MATKLKTADKTLKKALEKQVQIRQKRDEAATQLGEKKEHREALIYQVSNEEASEEALDQAREEIAKLEDRLEVQQKALERSNDDVERAKLEAFQAEQEAIAAEAREHRKRFDELWSELEALLPKLKGAQIRGHAGGGGEALAHRIYLRALGARPELGEKESSTAQHLANADRDRIQNELAQEERERGQIPPEPPRQTGQATTVGMERTISGPGLTPGED